MERKVREKAKAKVVAKVMRAQIAQKAGQGKKPKPKPKPKVHGMELFSSYFFTNLFFRFLAMSGGQSVHTQ